MKKTWNQLINEFDNAHLLQSSQWAEVKRQVGWTAFYLVWAENREAIEVSINNDGEFELASVRAAALALKRQIAPGISVLYLPKGPLLADWGDSKLRDRVLHDLEEFAKVQGVIQLKIDPDVILGLGVPEEQNAVENAAGLAFQMELVQRGWNFSHEQIQFRNTILVDLQGEEDQLLSRMKSKTRYNIRLAVRKGIQVRQGTSSDLRSLYQMYASTSIRGGFTIRGEDYYLSLWNEFIGDENRRPSDPVAQPLIAEYEGEPVAAAVIFKFGKRAWYLHGMSLPEHSEKMAPHLIQWEAMCWAKAQGCDVYDMWGAPDQFRESDSMWGVYRFKRGYGGTVVRTLGAWDYPARKTLYKIYQQWVPPLLGLMRWIGNRRTHQAAAE